MQGQSGLTALLILTALVSLPARAETLSPDVMRLYGGRYSTDCAGDTGPRLRVTPAALQVEAGGKRMSGREVLAAYSYFGQQAPPKGFQVALLSQVRPGAGLQFMIYRDKSGQYAVLEADGPVQAALGPALMAARYRHCETPAAAQAAPSPAPAPASLDTYPPQMLADPTFRAAYHKALGPKSKLRWLARLEGPGTLVRPVSVEGVDYRLVAVCKPHDCADNNMVVLYAKAERRLVGKVFEGGSQVTYLGAPSRALADELERLWTEEWRKH